MREKSKENACQIKIMSGRYVTNCLMTWRNLGKTFEIFTNQHLPERILVSSFVSTPSEGGKFGKFDAIIDSLRNKP